MAKKKDDILDPKSAITFREKLSRTLQTTTKQLIWLFAINGIIWIWCSYILAFMDKVQIAESLSSNVCTIVIGQMAFYLISKTIENVFKYNTIGGQSNRNALEREGIMDIENQQINNDSVVIDSDEAIV